jgi:EmrB/QacA subfamily drug resistance transporter
MRINWPMEQRWKVLIITSVGLFMAGLDLFIVNIAFPDLAADFNGTSLSSLSWVLNAYAIIFAALLVPAGRIADRVGRKRVLIAGLLLFSGASALCAVAPSIGVLIAARVLQATGGAMMIPTTLGLILPAFPPEQRPMAIGIWSAVGAGASALGPPIGGLLVQISWRWIFVVNVPIGVITAIVALRTLSEVREPGDRLPDLLGSAELALGIGLLTLGIVKGPDWGWGDPRALSAFAGALALIVAFVVRSAHHPAPVIELPLLRIRSFALANTAVAVFFAGFGAMLLASVLLLTEVWGYSALKAGLGLAPGPMMGSLFAIVAGRVGGRLGQRRVAVVGGLIFAASFAYILASTGPNPEYATTFLPGFMLGGVGVGLVFGTLPAVATAALPPQRFATGTAVFGMARQLGAAIGVAVLVALLHGSTGGDLLAGLKRGWWFTVGTGLVTAALALGFGRRQAPAPSASPKQEPEPAAEGAAA